MTNPTTQAHVSRNHLGAGSDVRRNRGGPDLPASRFVLKFLLTNLFKSPLMSLAENSRVSKSRTGQCPTETAPREVRREWTHRCPGDLRTPGPAWVHQDSQSDLYFHRTRLLANKLPLSPQYARGIHLLGQLSWVQPFARFGQVRCVSEQAKTH